MKDSDDVTDEHAPIDDGGLDQSKLDFDPADGYLTGTVLDGTTEIPGPHAYGPDVEADTDSETGAG